MSSPQRTLVEDEELGLRAEVGGVAHAGCLQVGLGALGNANGGRGRRTLPSPGSSTSQLQEQGGLFEEGVDVGGVGIGHQQHVRGFNALPASDRRTVKRVASRELVFVEVRHRHGDVLLFAAGVGEAEVNKLDFVFLHHLDHVCDGLGHQISPIAKMHGC